MYFDHENCFNYLYNISYINVIKNDISLQEFKTQNLMQRESIFFLNPIDKIFY